jgi:hypothetical protein
MSQFEHEDDTNSPALNEMIRELKKLPVTYDVTIIVRRKGASFKVKLPGIPRDKIMAEGYPEIIGSVVKAFEQSVVPIESEPEASRS